MPIEIISPNSAKAEKNIHTHSTSLKRKVSSKYGRNLSFKEGTLISKDYNPDMDPRSHHVRDEAIAARNTSSRKRARTNASSSSSRSGRPGYVSLNPRHKQDLIQYIESGETWMDKDIIDLLNKGDNDTMKQLSQVPEEDDLMNFIWRLLDHLNESKYENALDLLVQTRLIYRSDIVKRIGKGDTKVLKELAALKDRHLVRIKYMRPLMKKIVEYTDSTGRHTALDILLARGLVFAKPQPRKDQGTAVPV